jgi:hypothetical protein
MLRLSTRIAFAYKDEAKSEIRLWTRTDGVLRAKTRAREGVAKENAAVE